MLANRPLKEVARGIDDLLRIDGDQHFQCLFVQLPLSEKSSDEQPQMLPSEIRHRIGRPAQRTRPSGHGDRFTTGFNDLFGFRVGQMSACE